MGKYFDKLSNSDRDSLLINIANELAEANRLKRLELRMINARSMAITHGSSQMEFDGIIFDMMKELEDQA